MKREIKTAYFVEVVMVGESTEMDNQGCDGLYVQAVNITDGAEIATLRSENERLRGALEYVDKAINNASIFPAKQGLFAEIQDVIRSALKGGDVCKTLDAQGSDCAQKRGDE